MRFPSPPATPASAALAVVAFATGILPAGTAFSQSEVTPEDFVPRQVAVLGALDKITARERELVIPVGTSERFYGLTVMVRSCQSTTVSTTPQNAAFLEIADDSRYGRVGNTPASVKGKPEKPNQGTSAKPPLFTGWMFSASPSLSSMEHPIYDIVLKTCLASAPRTAQAPLPQRKHDVQTASVPRPTIKPDPVGDPQTAARED